MHFLISTTIWATFMWLLDNTPIPKNSLAKQTVLQLIKAYSFLMPPVPCHRNLHLILSNCLLTFAGNLYKESAYKGTADNTALVNVSLPPMDSSCPVQFCNFFPNLSIKNPQSEHFIFLSCKGTPKYWIGNLYSLQPNKLAKSLPSGEVEGKHFSFL